MKSHFFYLIFSFLTVFCHAQDNFKRTIDSLNHLLTQPIGDSTRVKTLSNLSREWEKRDIYKAITYSEQALDLVKKKQLKNYELPVMFQLGFQYKHISDFPKSIAILHQLLDIIPKGDIEITTVLIFLSKNYMDIGDYKSALYYHEATKKFTTFVYKNPTDTLPTTYDTREFLNYPLGLAVIYEKLNQLDSAIFYVQKSYNRLPHVPESDFWKTVFQWEILWSYGLIEQRLGHDSVALDLFRRALVAAKKLNANVHIEEVQMSLANYFYTHNQVDSAVFYAKIAFENSRKTPNYPIVQGAGFLLKSIYQQEGKTKTALYYFTIANAAKDTLLNVKKFQAVQRLSVEQERRDKTVALTLMAQQNRIKLVALLSGLLLLSAIIFILYYNNQQKQNLNKQLTRQKNEIENLNNNLELKIEERTAELQNALNDIKLAFNKGQTTERKRVSADLHDEIGSALSTIAMFSDITKIKAEKTAPQLVNELDRIGTKSRDMIQTMRDTIWTLNEDTQQSLWERMLLSCSETLEAKNTTLDWQLPPDDTLPCFSFNIKRNLFLAFKEAINNCIKHAKADFVKVKGGVENDCLILEISDNGKGFALNEHLKKGNGLQNFEKRMTEVGGKFSINSTIGIGTTLQFQVPISKNRD